MEPSGDLPFFAVELSHQRDNPIVSVEILEPDDRRVRVTRATSIQAAPPYPLTRYCGIHEGPGPDDEIAIGGERYICWATDALGGTRVLFFGQLWRLYELEMPPP